MRKVSHLRTKAQRLYGMPRQGKGVGHGIRERLNEARGLPPKYGKYIAATPTEHGKREGGR